MALVGRVGEELARTINRRTVVKRAAAAVFGAVAAWSVEGFSRNKALASHCAYVTTGDCSCNPPYGEFCARIDGSYCTGSACTGGCTYDESWRYVGGCWCSATCAYTAEDGSPINGYYKCCDCNCFGTQCSCREFVPGGSATHDDGSDTLVQPPVDRDNPDPVPAPGPELDERGFPTGFPFD
ncbi:MAG: hypothetical protein H0U10_01445 [Chloroflexia bacterium]|nr:hypothetical protein [Chloroflexia bacterium]